MTVLRLGILFSTSGDYGVLGRDCRDVEAASRRETDDPVKVRAALAGLEAPSPLGPLRIDPATNHANLAFLLGRISGADFVILQSRPAAVAEPYLIHRRPTVQPLCEQPELRIVS